MARHDKAQAVLELGAVDLVQACLARIEEFEPQVGAWAWLDGDHVCNRRRGLIICVSPVNPLGHCTVCWSV